MVLLPVAQPLVPLVLGSGFKIQGWGLGVGGLETRVQGSGFRFIRIRHDTERMVY